MSAPAPSDVRLVRKPLKPASARPAFSNADVLTSIRLVGSLAIAWALPQAWWPFIARRASWLGGKLGGKSTAAVAARPSGPT